MKAEASEGMVMRTDSSYCSWHCGPTKRDGSVPNTYDICSPRACSLPQVPYLLAFHVP